LRIINPIRVAPWTLWTCKDYDTEVKAVPHHAQQSQACGDADADGARSDFANGQQHFKQKHVRLPGIVQDITEFPAQRQISQLVGIQKILIRPVG
jgi:hypothetical protein